MMRQKLRYRNDRWCVATELHHPVDAEAHDNSLLALGRWMIRELTDWVRRQI